MEDTINTTPRAIPISEPKEGESAIYRSTLCPDGKLIEKPDEYSTLYEMMKGTTKKFAKRNCLGYRPLIKMHKEEVEVDVIRGGEKKKEKKTWSLPEMGAYQWFTYEEIWQKINFISEGFLSLGLKPNKSRMAIYLDTCWQWLVISHSCFAQSVTVVTVYANLGEEGLLHSLQECNVTHICTSADLLPHVKNVLDQAPQLKTIIYIGEISDELKAEFDQTGIILCSLESLYTDQKEKEEYTHHPPKSEDLAVIMYTSGSTGLPKGVMISHRNLLSMEPAAQMMVNIQPEDIYIAYLPLAHVLELAVSNTLFYCGASLGYGSPRTLTDASVKNCHGDLRELKPTIMAGVPAVWEKVRKAVLDKIAQQNFIARSIFWTSYAVKKWFIQNKMKAPLVDNIFAKIKEITGGRLRAVLSGGAPISEEAQWFLRVCIADIAVQGYGLTETCGPIALLPLDHTAVNRAGAPIPTLELKLVDVPDMGYFSTNKPFPQGEVWVRGTNVTSGYYKNEEKTKESYIDGWFATGDIGQIHGDGTISIIDRKKNLVKLSHGEYIALERMESRYMACPFLDQICVYGDSFHSYPVAVIVPSRKEAERWAETNSVGFNFEELCSNDKFKKQILISMNEVAKQANLKPFEQVKDIYLTPEEWTPENGMTTAAMKLKRQAIAVKFKDEIESMYK